MSALDIAPVEEHTDEDGTDSLTLQQDLTSYLSFYLSNEIYGIPLEQIEEIRVWEEPTLIPNSPEFVKGVINLRGMIVPVIDLRQRFNIGEPIYTPTTVMLVVSQSNAQTKRLMGLVVDSVSDVLPGSDKELSPAVGEANIARFIVGLFNVEERVVSVFDIEELTDINQILDGVSA